MTATTKLKFSERLRVHAAVASHVVVEAETARQLAKALDFSESARDRLTALAADINAREKARDEATFTFIRSIGIVCLCLTAIGLLL